MIDIFISYARSTAARAAQIAEALRALGYGVWRDDELPAHRSYAEVIEERLKAAKAVIVVWSAEAVKSQWVQSEADRARTDGKLVQVTLDGAPLPMPFDRIQCADLSGWSGDTGSPSWRKVLASIADLAGLDAETQAPRGLDSSPVLDLPNKPSIAVLPFTDMTGAGDQDYFVDGMVEEIVGALSRFRSIFVIAGSATLSFKGRAASARQVARELGVRYVLEGSVRKAGNRVRIAVKLTDADNGEQIWGDRFEDTLEDVFALQDKIALGAAGVIEPAVREAEIRRSARRPTANLGSYDFYLRAWAILRTYAWSDMPAAIALAERAVELDPDFGQAWSLAGRCHYLVYLYGWSNDAEHHRRQALEFGRRAIRAAPDDAQVLGWTAMLDAFLEHDLPTALAMSERAVSLNPGAAHAWFASGAVRILSGQLDLAVEHLETSIRLNPVGPDRAGGLLFLAMAKFQQQRFAEACALARELFQHFENPTGCAILAAGLAHLGQIDAARAALADYKRLSRQPVDTFASLVWPLEDQRMLFLRGIAMAQGRGPGEALG